MAQEKKPKPFRPRSAKVASQNAHLELVLAAAQTVTHILQSRGMHCAVFGSLAAKLYGSQRCPKDVDLLVIQDGDLEQVQGSSSESSDSSGSNSNSNSSQPSPLPSTSHLPSNPQQCETSLHPNPNPDANPHSNLKQPLLSAEHLKILILTSNTRNFFLKLPLDPQATFRILYYRKWYQGPECKVDILTPGIMHLPALRKELIRYETMEVGGGGPAWSPGSPGGRGGSRSRSFTIPVVPFPLLLLHKLQGWDDHRKAVEPHKRDKQHQDAGDVRKLMGLRRFVAEMKERREGQATQGNLWDDTELFGEEFMELTRVRVKEYCRAFPDRAEEWRLIGFEVDVVAVDDVGERLKSSEGEQDEKEKGDDQEVP